MRWGFGFFCLSFWGFCLNFDQNPMSPPGNVHYFFFPSNQTSKESFLGSSEHGSAFVHIIATVDLCLGRKKIDENFK